MLLEFLHHEKKCVAFVNDRQLRSNHTFTVYILDCNNELGYELIFLPGESMQWDTAFSIKYKHPATYNNICEKLEETFRGNRFLKRITLPQNTDNSSANRMIA